MTVLDIRVAAGANDGEWTSAGAFSSTNALNINLGSSAGTTTYSGFFRFLNVTVPGSDTIDVANMVFRSWGNADSGVTCNARILAHLAANPAAPTSHSGVTSAPRTTAFTDWSNIPPVGADADFTSAEFPAVMQELVSQGSWASGNAVVLFVENNGSSPSALRHIRPYEFASATAPLLHIEYSPPNTAPTITVAPTASYGSLTRLGPLNTPAVVSFTATDADGDALTYEIRTAAGGGGTLVASGTCTSGTTENVNIANSDPGLVDGSQTLYLRVHDGAVYSADSSFSLLRDTTAPTVGTITTNPDPVVS